MLMLVLVEVSSQFISIFFFIRERNNFSNLMEKQLLLALSVLALGCYSFAKPNEEPSVKINITVNTDHGSTHESVALVNEDGKWKALKDRNSGARQMSISSRLAGILLPEGAEFGRF